MIMLEEFKKNIKFFILMALVLTLLMAAGVSLFNFSFEINKKIYDSFEDDFKYGYSVTVEGYMQNSDELRQNGVSYAAYGRAPKKIPGVDESWFGAHVYQFEDYPHKVFEQGLMDYKDFIIDGGLWSAADNGQHDGKYPIFISDSFVSAAQENGIAVNVGDVIKLCEQYLEGGEALDDEGNIIIGGEFVDGESREFYVKGIYRRTDLPYEWQIPEAVISIAAEQDFRQDEGEIDDTGFILNSVKDYKKFAAYAKKTGLEYYAGIEEEITLVGIFSGVFISVSIAILILCGAISFVYCGMFVNKRLNYIGLLKALGMKSFDISKQFFVLLLIIFSFSFLVGNVFSVLISKHFARLALTLFDYKINTGFNLLSQGIFAALTVVIVFLSILLLNRRIAKISVSQTLTQKE